MTAVSVVDVAHTYRSKRGEREALRGVSFEVSPGEIFGLLGPNGGGKTTLFRLLATLLPLQRGTLTVGEHSVASDPAAVRRQLGVTFQSPSLDPKLTVWENVVCQGAMYGLSGTELKERGEKLLTGLGVLDRKDDIAETLSGGLKRRAEIAKGLLHRPRVLLLDEPSTGLDPGARRDLWDYLDGLRRDEGVTVLATTHLMEEADRCDRLGILSAGELIAEGTADELRTSVGGDCVTVQASDPDRLSGRISERFGLEPARVGSALRIERDAGHEFVRELVSEFGDEVDSVTLGKPTLEDVFLQRTGHRFWDADAAGVAAAEELLPKRRKR